jgi:hypothetical protein
LPVVAHALKIQDAECLRGSSASRRRRARERSDEYHGVKESSRLHPWYL